MNSDCIFFFFNDTATTEIYTLSLHDALPISAAAEEGARGSSLRRQQDQPWLHPRYQREVLVAMQERHVVRSEEHTSELQSRLHLVCRLLLEKKKKTHHSDCNTTSPAHASYTA